ncbi:MAG: hypothetical protein K6E21_00095 [Bacilli bacterium]|nr:hypothetical protein [Bacilli bacterium]
MANKELECPCCGGTLHFDSKTQDIVCPYCDSHFSVDDLKAYTDDLASDKEEDVAWDESTVQQYSNQEMKGMKVYSCESCGGEIIVDETTTSTCCPYCGNNVLVSKQMSGDLKPNICIPFKKDKDNVLESLKGFFKKKPLLPSSFSKDNTIQEIKPLYVPFWLFDADVDGKVRFKGETTRTWSDANYNYRETKYYSLVRGGDIAFDRVPVDGSQKMEDQLMESIEPYDSSEAVEFNAGYLAGYAADRYDVEKDVTFNRATERFRDGTISAFRSDIHGYSNVTLADSNLQLSNTKTAYALYPVWILNTKWREKNYRFAVNGQTGKVAGDLPVSPLKFFLFWMLFFIIPAGIIFAICAANDLLVGGIVIALIVGSIISTSILMGMRSKNKTVHFQYGASSYVRENSFHITLRKDIFLYRKVTKTPRASSNNGDRR